MTIRALITSGIILLGAMVHATQAPAPDARPISHRRAPTPKPEEGIPITDQTVLKACGTCHRPDDKSQMSRISFQRNTPEGWQNTIQRMAALNGLNIDPVTARHVVKYLSNNLGLAPEEARPATWEVEKRWIDFKYTANADAESTCNKCHSLGRVISQRRTRGEWDLLVAMHRGWYPLTDNQAFRRDGTAAHRPIGGRPAAGHAPPGGEGDRSPRQHVPAEDPRVDGVVRHDAAGAPRRHVGPERVGAGEGRDLRTRHGDHGSRHTR